MITILYDTDIFIRQKYGGIRLYFSSLINKLSAFPVAIQPDPLHLQSLEPRSSFYDSIAHFSRITYSLTRSLRPSSDRAFVYHPTYYSDPFLPYYKYPSVVTIHDLIHEKYYEFFDSSYSTRRLRAYVDAKLTCMLHATAIIAVSQATADDILDVYPFIDSSKIFVIPHGSDHLSSYPIVPSPLSSSLEYLSKDPFFLYVGSRSNYKGFYILLRSFKSLCIDFPSLRLICVGSSFTFEEYKAISYFGLSSHVISYSALNSELPYLYSTTLGLIYPSFCEGFGLPILEALSFNCPVVCSNIPPFLEIGGDLPFYYPPNDFQELTYLLRRLALNSLLIRKDQLNSSKLHSSLFSWSNTAKLTYELYSQIQSI